MAKKKNFYAVRNGREIGIFTSWDECRKMVEGFTGAEYKGFMTKEDAVLYMENKEKAIQTDKDSAIAYVDGSYNIADGRFSFGAVLFYEGKEMQFSSAFSDFDLSQMRNVAGEIKGAEFIMKYCVENKIPRVIIYYDYEGIEKWCTGEWQAKKEGTNNYRNVYLMCRDKVEISFVKVKGHSGDKYNDLADKLAKSVLGIE